MVPLRTAGASRCPGRGELGTSGVGGTLSPSSDGCALPGTAADPWVWLRCRGKKLSLTPAFASLLQTLARQREGGRGGNPSQPLVLLKLKVREPRELKGVRSRQAVTDRKSVV